MKVDVYAICWNEAHLIDFFFEHYDPIATRYVFFDDGSEDGTPERIAAHPRAEIRRFERTVVDSFVQSTQALHDTVWKESRGRADWALITAIDEHLVHRDLPAYLRRCLAHGATMVPALGFQMVSDTFPHDATSLAGAVPRGAPFEKMSKLCLLRPDRIAETNFAIGRHSAAPTGDVVLPARDEVLNLHFKYLGLDRVQARHGVLASGLGPKDVHHGWGHRYWFGRDELRADFEKFRRRSLDLHALGWEAAAAAHEKPRWWRDAESPYPSVDIGDG